MPNLALVRRSAQHARRLVLLGVPMPPATGSVVRLRPRRRRGEITFRVLERLVGVVRETTERIMDLSTLGAMPRVYVEILRLAVPDAASPDLWIVRPVPPGARSPTARARRGKAAARALSQLRQGGIVRRKGRNLYILDRARLEKIVEMLGHGGRT